MQSINKHLSLLFLPFSKFFLSPVCIRKSPGNYCIYSPQQVKHPRSHSALTHLRQQCYKEEKVIYPLSHQLLQICGRYDTRESGISTLYNGWQAPCFSRDEVAPNNNPDKMLIVLTGRGSPAPDSRTEIVFLHLHHQSTAITQSYL